MIIWGVALLAICTLAGALLGEGLGALLGVKSNVGGVGIAMLLLIGARLWLGRRGLLGRDIKLGVEFWAALYIPIVVAMAAQQNVLVALRGGPMVIAAAVATVACCFAGVALLARVGGAGETMDEIEAIEASRAEAIVEGRVADA